MPLLLSRWLTMPGLSREILLPFQVGQDGGIAWTDDRVTQATQQILSVVATKERERVMRPTYGTPLMALLFEADDPLVQNEVRSRMSVALKQWLPGVVVEDISLEDTNPEDSTAIFRISFRLPGDTTTHIAAIQVGGTVQEFTVS